MAEFIEEIFTGRFKILAWFFLAVIFIYIPGLIIMLYRRQRRGEEFLKDCPDAAVVKILRSKLTGNLTVHSVDKKKPVLISKGINFYLYLTPGEHTLELSYYWTKISLIGKLSRYYDANHTVNGKSAKKRVVVRPYGKYSLYYDSEREKYYLDEIGGYSMKKGY